MNAKFWEINKLNDTYAGSKWFGVIGKGLRWEENLGNLVWEKPKVITISFGSIIKGLEIWESSVLVHFGYSSIIEITIEKKRTFSKINISVFTEFEVF